jgi:hypothetical protein
MLASVLDAEITSSVVRLGSRATDERIEKYSLFKLEQTSGRGDLDWPIRREYAAMKGAEEEVTRTMNRIQLPGLTWEDTEKFLNIHYPHHAEYLRRPPFWIAEHIRREKAEGFTEVRYGRKKASRDDESAGIYGFWKNCRDIDFIQLRPPSARPPSANKKTYTDPRIAFFNEVGFNGRFPHVPYGRRSLQQLTGVGNVWSMSRHERQRLAESWEDDMHQIAYDTLLTKFDQLRERYRDACKSYEDTQDEVSQFGDQYSPPY